MADFERIKMHINKTKSRYIKKNLFALNTCINGETAVKPYYYLSNNKLHVRYTVDRCVALSKTEVAKLNADLIENPSYKQNILAKTWNFLTLTVEKTVIMDGLVDLKKQIKGGKNG